MACEAGKAEEPNSRRHQTGWIRRSHIRFLQHRATLTVTMVQNIGQTKAIGAQVKATTKPGKTLNEHVSTCVGFMSSSDRRVHQRPGNKKEIREFEIRCPSGIAQHIEHPAADRILRIEESSSKQAATEKKAQQSTMGQGVAP